MYLLILIDVLLYTCTTIIIINAKCAGKGPDFWCWFNKTKFSYHCVHPIHAKMFSIQLLLHSIQIAPRVCTLVLFIIIAKIVATKKLASIAIIFLIFNLYLFKNIFAAKPCTAGYINSYEANTSVYPEN